LSRVLVFISSHFITLIKGVLVGIANIIPGVSGGTFALILGIYERLLGSIGSYGFDTVRVFFAWLAHPGSRERREGLYKEFRRTDSAWLLVLLAGTGCAILASSHLIVFLLDEHLAPTLAFFIGLIIPSILVPYGLLGRKSIREAVSCLIAAAALIGLTLLFDTSGGSSGGLVFLFVSGVVAISAMILPGVSGSFILMVLGEYRSVLDAINNMDWLRLAVFAAGCILGILAFVRLLNYLLKRYHDVTMAFLIGLILGSLWVLWPFKEVLPGAKIVTGTNILPVSLDAGVLWSAGTFAFGLLCSAGLYRLGKTEETAVSTGGRGS
jgi:putative membrane protein